MGIKKHHHKLEKVYIGKNKDHLVYICRLPDCSYYAQPIFLPGKSAECYRCGKPFIISKIQVRKGKEMKKLHCENCTHGKVKKEKLSAKVDVTSLLTNLGITIED